MSNEGSNNWNVGYPAIRFFEQVLSNHTAVSSCTRPNDIQFAIRRRNGLSDVNVILVEVYMLGEAALYGVLGEFNGVTAVVNNGNWNCIAFDWKEVAQKTGVSVFLMADFLGALNVDRLEKYIPHDLRQARRRKGSEPT